MSIKVNKTTKKSTPESQPEKPATKDLAPQAHPLLALREEIDSVFDNFFSGFSLSPFAKHTFSIDPFKRFEEAFGKLSMKTDVKESDKTFSVIAELPGLDENEIDVSVSDGVLIICAEKKEETHKDDEDFHLNERHYGAVKRRFTLPKNVDPDKATASFKNGVLNITFPKKASPKAKKIPIKK